MTKAKPQSLSRRQVLTAAVEVSAAGVVLAWGFGFIAARDARARWVPRPPGAIDDMKAFLAACSRCGQCVTACPYDTLSLASPSDPAPAGTPFFVPRKVPCYMCVDIPCVKACPTGALDHSLTEIEKARMGVALIDPDSCLSFQGLRCEVCYRACPETDKAIVIDSQPRELSRHAKFLPVVKPEHCTGCGLCEQACPTDSAAIRVAERDAVLGRIGRHYRLGWLGEDDVHNRPETVEQKPAVTEDESTQNALDSLKAFKF